MWMSGGLNIMDRNAKPVIAMMYDFDKTLCTKDMQEYGFIPNLGLKPEQFWSEAGSLAKDHKMDRVLSYMYLVIRKSHDHHSSIRRDTFVSLGSSIEFYPGVIDWFSRINRYGREIGADVEHYIISSGLKEIIEGCQIYKEFKEVYACEFYYDENGVAVWPKSVINYTTKTQFLFRINKGVLDVSDDDSLNRFLPDDERSVPFRNMLYFGDGPTDIPCMKLVKSNGGYSIAVYKSRKTNVVRELLTDGRVDFIARADYSEGKELDRMVKKIMAKMVATDELVELHRKQF